jgi:hypothetical protein
MRASMPVDSLKFIVGRSGVSVLFHPQGEEEFVMKGTGRALASIQASLPMRQKLYQQDLQRGDSVVKLCSF